MNLLDVAPRGKKRPSVSAVDHNRCRPGFRGLWAYYYMGPWLFHLSKSWVCFLFFLLVCFTSYFVFSCIAVLPHSPGVVYYHLLLRRETRIPRVAPFSFRIGIWDLFVHRGQKSYTPTAFGKLWTTPGVRCMQHASS